MAKECHYTYTAISEPGEGGGFVETFPMLVDLITKGDTLEEVRVVAVEALQSYLQGLAKEGRPITSQRGSVQHAAHQEGRNAAIQNLIPWSGHHRHTTPISWSPGKVRVLHTSRRESPRYLTHPNASNSRVTGAAIPRPSKRAAFRAILTHANLTVAELREYP
jgi:predicted RNase H-like HicB family nuclease